MQLWAKMGLVGVGLLAAGLILIFVGSKLRQRTTSQLIDDLRRTATDKIPANVNFKSLSTLPEPVEEYFRHVLTDGQPLIRVARFTQEGELRSSEESDRWSPFSATQVVSPGSPGFVWDARISIMPFVHVRVRDGYVNGQGSGQVSILSAITIAHDEGGAELNSGALHRYLAEAVWYPTALLPSEGVDWSPIDGSRALATLTDAGVTVSLEFRFNDTGEVTGIYTPGRYGRFSGAYQLTPWEGFFGSYERSNGMLVPTQGEVGWHIGNKWQSFWRGHFVEIGYEFVEGEKARP